VPAQIAQIRTAGDDDIRSMLAAHIGGGARLTDVRGPITQRETDAPAAQIQSASPVLAPMPVRPTSV
jgi:hypothetical protein